MASSIDHVQALAESVGPRPVSTEEEHQSALYVAQELTDAGLEVDIDEFATPTGVRWPYALAYMLVVVGAVVSGIGTFNEVLSTSMFALGLILELAGLFIFFTELTDRGILSKALSRGISQNVVAKYVPSSVQRESRRRKIIIVAHLDTVKAEPEASPVIINHRPLLRRIIQYVMLGEVALLFVRMLPIPWPAPVDIVLWVLCLVAALLLLAEAICIGVQRFIMPFVAGGNDNASGVAVMIEVAKRVLDPTKRALQAAQDAEDAELLEEDNYDEYAEEDETPVEIHDAEQALEAGVVPEGAVIEYADFSAAQTTEMEPVASDPGATQVIPFASLDADPGKTAIVAEVAPVAEAAPEFVAEFSADSVEVAPGGNWPSPEEMVDVEPEPEPELQPEPEPEPIIEGIPSWYAAAKRKAAEKEAEEGVEEQSEPEVRSRFADMQLERTTSLAAEMAAAEARKSAAEAAEEETVEAAAETEEESAPVVEEAPSTHRHVSLHTGEEISAPEPAEKAAESVSEEPEAEEKPSIAKQVEFELGDILAPPSEEAIEHEAAGHLDVSDDELDSALSDWGSTPESVEGAAKTLDSRIPAIGSSGTKSAGEHVSEMRDEIEAAISGKNKPIVLDSEEPASDASQENADASENTDDAPVKKERKPRPMRKKPTARHVTEEFQPTKAVDRRNDVGLGMTQAAAVSSTYEDTPQGGPEFDPFAPKAATHSQQPAVTTPRPQAGFSTQEAPISPSQSTSFPKLTGSFPALSSQQPAIDQSAFGTPAPGATGSFPSFGGSAASVSSSDFDLTSSSMPSGDQLDAQLDSFVSGGPGMTTEIEMPESRFRNAVDGLFHRGKKNGGKKKRFGRKDGADETQQWDAFNEENEDDFGWKGGGYFEETGRESAFEEARRRAHESQEAFDAARERAHQIAESVVSMTEKDLLDKEVWFVGLGASAANNNGMRNFLELHSSELRGALIINLEAVGAGDICFVDVEGGDKPHKADRRLQTLVRKASSEIGEEITAEVLDWRDTDATPAMRAGLRAMTIMGFDGAAPAGWHWSTDTADNVDEEKMEYVTELLLKMIEES